MQKPLQTISLLLLGLVLLGIAIFGRGKTVVPDDREVVVFWHFWGGSDRQTVEEIVGRFNDSQNEYFVRAISMPGSNLDLKAFLTIAGGDPPDLMNQDDPIVADWAKRGVLTPLEDLASPQEYSDLNEWLLPAAQKLGSYGGKMYALCNGLDIRALYYNKTLLEEYNLSPPTTIQELDHIARTIAPPADSSGRTRVGFLPDPRRLWAWGIVFGGSFYNPNAATIDESITADRPEIVEALTWMKSYTRDYGAAEVSAFRSGDQALAGAVFPLLSNRRYAMIMDGQWRIRDIAKVAASQKNLEAKARGEIIDEIGVIPLPSIKNGRKNAGWVNGNFFIVPKGAKCPDGAWAFMKFWSGFAGHEAEAAKACAAGGWIPASKQVMEHPTYQKMVADNPQFQTFLDLAASENQIPTPSIPAASQYYQEVIDAAQDVMYRNADPKERLSIAAKRIRQRLKRLPD